MAFLWSTISIRLVSIIIFSAFISNGQCCLFVRFSRFFFLCRIMKYSLDFSHLHFNSAHCRKRSSQRHFCHMDFIYFGYKSIDLFRSQRCLFPVWLHWIDQQFVSLKIHKKAYEDQTKQKEWNEKAANFTALTRKKSDVRSDVKNHCLVYQIVNKNERP